LLTTSTDLKERLKRDFLLLCLNGGHDDYILLSYFEHVFTQSQQNTTMRRECPVYQPVIGFLSHCGESKYHRVFKEISCGLDNQTVLIEVFQFLKFDSEDQSYYMCLAMDRPLIQVGSRRKRCPRQFGQDGMGSIPATPSTKHASCFPPSCMPASIEISIKLIVCLAMDIWFDVW
jgi:hypothetical protein